MMAHDDMTNFSPDNEQEERQGIWSPAFAGLLLTQFFTAANDHIFRWLAIGIGKDYVDKEHESIILMLGTAMFVLPYLVLAALAGYLADRFRKRDVIVVCKIAEIVLMGAGILAIYWDSPTTLFVVLGLIGSQSALFAPAKMGSIPEALHPRSISLANGLFGLATVAATVVGMSLGNWLKDETGLRGQQAIWLPATVLLGVACVGLVASLFIRQFAASDPHQAFPWNALSKTYRELRLLSANRAMFRVALGMFFFWGLANLAQLNIDQFAPEGGAKSASAKDPLMAAMVIGLGVGSVLAGVWSNGRVELGILPLGAFGLVICAMLMFTVDGRILTPTQEWTGDFRWACVLLFGLGTSAALFSVPLDAYIQHRSPPQSRGAVLAAANFMTFTGVLLSAVLFALLRWPVFDNAPLFSARQIFLLAGISTIPVFIYIIWLIPQASIRFIVWLASKTIYRIQVFGHENLPERGGALVVSNHVSFIDAVLLLLTSSRPIRMVAWSGNFQGRFMRWLANLWGAILISQKPKSIVAALKTARQALLDGELVCIFPEGAITRTGQMQAFKPGLLRIVDKTQVPIVPVYLEGLWGSIFSFRDGKFFWKWPRKWPFPVSIHFGPPVKQSDNLHSVRQAVQDLSAQAVSHRMTSEPHLIRDFIRMCKKRKSDWKVADSLSGELSGGMLLIRSLILRRLLRRHVLADSETHVGVLLPPSQAAVITNMALALDRRVSVNLNYTVSSEVLNACIAQAGIRHVVSSRSFLSKMNFQLSADVICLEDLKNKPTRLDKVFSAFATYVLPAGLLARSIGAHRWRADDPLTVIFTSGSTGTPKGVVLTLGNIAHNVAAVEQAVQLSDKDVLIGVLPFFHSFGYTITFWMVMSVNIKGVYHYNPLDAKQIGKLIKKYGVTIILATPTFLRSYLRRCEKDDLATLDVVVAGAEKLPLELCDGFEEKFGIRPVEGYGATELSPLVSVNIPPSRSKTKDQVDRKEGTVGRPVNGVAVKIVDLETGADLKPGEAGMLLVRGPNVMQGYLGRPDLTADVMRGGWYVTGDVALIDNDGFIKITGRESRFSKIGGEMVPHLKIEETLNKIIGTSDEEGLKVVVTAVPDEKKGERLVVIHTKLAVSPSELCKGLAAAGLPNLFIPSQDSFYEVDQIPILGTGKLDLHGIKQMAQKFTQ